MPDFTPEELARKQEEAMKAAQEAWDKLTPEEKAKAEEEARKLMEQMAAERQRTMDLVEKSLAEKKAKETPGPRFCTNCGAPVNGGKFCTNCGNPL